jgi:hypothetical protein
MNTRVIDHEEATRNLMAERYLLGELAEGERDSYEEHLFSCQDCFEQIKVGTELVSQIRQLGPDTADSMPAFMSRIIKNVSQPFTIAALGLFLFSTGFAVHQNSVISQLKAPRPELRYTLVGIAHGSSDINLVQIAKDSTLSLNVEYARNGEFISYLAKIITVSGKTVHSVALPEKQVGTMASIDMLAETLKPGQYSIVVFGRKSDGTQEEVGRSMFELQIAAK